jgi:hypothetical protein
MHRVGAVAGVGRRVSVNVESGEDGLTSDHVRGQGRTLIAGARYAVDRGWVRTDVANTEVERVPTVEVDASANRDVLAVHTGRNIDVSSSLRRAVTCSGTTIALMGPLQRRADARQRIVTATCGGVIFTCLGDEERHVGVTVNAITVCIARPVTQLSMARWEIVSR